MKNGYHQGRLFLTKKYEEKKGTPGMVFLAPKSEEKKATQR